MSIFNLFSFRKKGEVEVVGDSAQTTARKQSATFSVADVDMYVTPFVASTNFISLFNNVPEVFFPIDYIASRVAGATYVVKRDKDDSIVWHNKPMNQILSHPNCMSSWYDLVYQHFVYKLATGNSYIRAAMADTFQNADKFRYCDNFWVLPANHVEVESYYGIKIPMFGIAEKEDLIKDYRLNYGVNGAFDIPVYQVFHDRDGMPNFIKSSGFTKSNSRLEAQLKPISNLIATYEARNVIYVKRGGLGFIISKKQDPTGTVALTEADKQELASQVDGKYGVGKNQLPYGISNQPIDFIRTNLSIKELEPFEETLADAISIAGAYGIPAVLVPRKDQSTFSNQSTAEKAVYTSKIIPLAQQFCKDMTHFLGLDNAGLYLEADFSAVDCLQVGRKEAEEVKTLIDSRCRLQFTHGLITLNDWRAQIGESMVEDPLFVKLKFEMSDDELNRLNRVINNNTQVEDDGRNQTPAVQDEGK